MYIENNKNGIVVLCNNGIFRNFSVPLEMESLRREHFNRWYNLIPYYLSIISFEIPFQVELFEIAFIII